MGHGLSAATTCRRARDGATGSACRSAAPLGARHDPDSAARMDAVRARAHDVAASLLLYLELLLPVRDTAPCLLDGSARVPAARAEHHRCIAPRHPGVRRRAHVSPLW